MARALRLPGGSQRLLAPLAMLLVLLLLTTSSQAQNNACGGNQINCEVCGDGSRSNDIAGLPRLDKNLESVSNDLGSYPWFECDTSALPPGANGCPQGSVQTVAFDFWSDGSNPLDVINSEQTEGVGPYVQALANYWVFGITMCVFTGLLGLALFCGRCVFPCCTTSDCMTCGGTDPRPRHKLLSSDAGMGVLDSSQSNCCSCCGLLGFQEEANGLDYEYSTKEKWFARILMFLFVLFTLVWIGMGQFEGNEGLTQAMKDASKESPMVLAGVLQTTIDPIGDFVVALVGVTGVGLLRDLNQTITNATDLRLVDASLQCALDGIAGATNVSQLELLVDDLEQGIVDVRAEMNQTLAPQLELLRNQSAALTQLLDDARATSFASLNHSLYDQLRDTAIADGYAVVAELRAHLETLLLGAGGSGGLTNISFSLETLDAGHPLRPTPAEYTAVIDALAAVLADGSPEIPALLSALQTVEDKLTGLPDYDAAADWMDAHNQAVADLLSSGWIAGAVARLEDARDLANAEIGGIAGRFDLIIDDLVANMSQAADLSNLSQAITASYELIVGNDSVISLGPLIAELQAKVQQIQGVMPCLQVVADEIRQLNLSVVELPQAMNDLLDLPTTVQQTVDDMVTEVNSFIGQLELADEERRAVNVSEITDKLAALEESFNNSLNGFDRSGLINALQALETAVGLIDWDAMILALQTLDSDLVTAGDYQAADVTWFRQLQSTLSTLLSDMGEVESSAAAWSQGWCQPPGGGPPSGSQQLCAADSACTSPLVCLGIGEPRCNLQAEQACDADADCTQSGDYCLADSGRLVSLSTDLTDSRDQDLAQEPEPLAVEVIRAAQQSAVEDAEAAATVFELQLALVEQAVEDAPISTYIFSVWNDLAAEVSNLGALNGTGAMLDDLFATLDQIDVSQGRQALVAINDSLADASDAQSAIEDAQEYVRVLADVAYDLLDDYLDDLSENSLIAVRAQSGLSGVVLHSATVLDDLFHYLRDNAPSVFDDVDVDLVGRTEDIRRVLDAFTANPAQQGALHWSFNLLDTVQNWTSSGSSKLLFEGATAYRIGKDANGNSYPDDQMCLSNACIDNEIEYWNTETISTITEGDINLELSREELVGLPYLFPFFIALFGAAAMLLGMAGCDKVATCLSTTACSCTLIFLPFAFLIIGFLYPTVIAGGDMCYSAENIGYRYLEVLGDEACTELLGGTGTLHGCTMEISTDLVATIDIDRAFRAVFGGCSASNDPFQMLYGNLTDGIVSVPHDAITRVIDEAGTPGSSFPLQLRSPVQQNLRDFANLSESIFQQLVTDASASLGCQSLNRVVSSTKGAFCCHMLTSFYWALSSWYLLCFTLLFCGISSTMLGRKRFRQRLWGGAYDQVTCAPSAAVTGAPALVIAGAVGGMEGAGAATAYPAATVGGGTFDYGYGAGMGTQSPGDFAYTQQVLAEDASGSMYLPDDQAVLDADFAPAEPAIVEMQSMAPPAFSEYDDTI